MSLNLNNKKGFSIMEILIAVALFTISISLTITMVSDSQNVVVNRENNVIAKNLSQEGLSGASVIIKNNWYGIADGQYGLSWANNIWNLSGTQDTQSIFTRKITVVTIQNGERSIKSTITWQETPLRPQEKVELTTILTNWVNVANTGGDDGGSGVSGNWRNPRTLGSVDLGPGNSATDLDVKNKIVYLSATASSEAKPDFYIVNATDGQNPFIVSSLNTGSGLNAIDTAGNYAYVANSDVDSQLQIIDVTSITNPSFIKSFKLSGVSGIGAIGNSIFYSFKKIYIGTKKATGSEFHIVDVSNPNNPTELGSFEINYDVNSIVVANNKAYIATGNTSKELTILDVSNPSNITELGSLNASGSTAGRSIFLSNASVFLGKDADTNSLIIANISNPSSITQTSSTNLSSQGVNDINMRDNLAFIGTTDPNKEFQVWDISNLSVPSLWATFNFPQLVSGIDYEDNFVYVSVRSNDALRIITSSP